VVQNGHSLVGGTGAGSSAFLKVPINFISIKTENDTIMKETILFINLQ
jgi:hypothetical protein